MTDVVETIVRAGLEPAGWGEVANALGGVLKSPMAGIHIQDIAGNICLYQRFYGVSDSTLATYQADYSNRNPWFEHKGLMRPGRILTDATIEHIRGNTRAFENTPFYCDLFRQHDYRHHIGGIVSERDGVAVSYALARSAQIGPYTPNEIAQLASLSRYISVAVDLSRRLEMLNMRLRAAEAVADRMRFGLIFATRNLQIVYANAQAERLLRQGFLSCLGGRLCLPDRARASRLHQRIADLASTRGRHAGPVSGRIECGETRAPLSITAIPVPREMRIFALIAPAIAVIITDPQAEPSVAPEHWQARFGLTPAEVRVAERIVAGLGPREIADLLEIRYETVRWHIKQLQQKTGTRRHSQLQQLLSLDIINFIQR